jgi:hypothetical protein
MWNALHMPVAVDKSGDICGSQGWLDRQIVQGVVLVNVIAGDGIVFRD